MTDAFLDLLASSVPIRSMTSFSIQVACLRLIRREALQISVLILFVNDFKRFLGQIGSSDDMQCFRRRAAGTFLQAPSPIYSRENKTPIDICRS